MKVLEFLYVGETNETVTLDERRVGELGSAVFGHSGEQPGVIVHSEGKRTFYPLARVAWISYVP